MSHAVEFFLLQLTLLAVVLVLHTYIGLHIVRRTLIFSDLVLNQLAALGALAGIGAGVGYGTTGSYVFSFFAVLAGAGLLAAVNPANRLIPREAVIGIMYAMALVASLLIGDKLAGGSAYVEKTLVGAMLWVSWPLVFVTAGTYAALLAFHYVFRRKFIALTTNPAPDRLWDFLLFATAGVITVLIVPIAGVLLAYALLMIPATIVAMFTKGWRGALIWGWVIGLAACAAGVAASYRYDLPYGPTLVLAMGAAFAAAVIVRMVLPRGGGNRTKGAEPCRS